jgi:hypothetical protein
MVTKLSRKEVLSLLKIWKNWMYGPEPAKNKPEAFQKWEKRIPTGINAVFGTVLHLFLWGLAKFGLLLRIPKLTVWASRKSIKKDFLWWEPISCGMNNSYTDMGLAYLQLGSIEKAIECLSKSCLVYPCPHNTTFGLKSKLCKKLSSFPEATDAVQEYRIMWKKFKLI